MTEQYTQDQDYTPNPYGEVTVPQTEAGSILIQTNPSLVLQEIEHQLRGEQYNPENEKWDATQEPLMNNKGINKVMTTLRGVVNTNCILSNLSEDDVYRLALCVADDITMDLCANYKSFAVDKSDFDRIIDLCTNMCFFSLKRSYNEGERKFLKTTLRLHETRMIKNEEEKRKGWSGWMANKGQQ